MDGRNVKSRRLRTRVHVVVPKSNRRTRRTDAFARTVRTVGILFTGGLAGRRFRCQRDPDDAKCPPPFVYFVRARYCVNRTRVSHTRGPIRPADISGQSDRYVLRDYCHGRSSGTRSSSAREMSRTTPFATRPLERRAYTAMFNYRGDGIRTTTKAHEYDDATAKRCCRRRDFRKPTTTPNGFAAITLAVLSLRGYWSRFRDECIVVNQQTSTVHELRYCYRYA